MKKIFLTTIILSAAVLSGCVKPESIPSPTNNADLKIHFEGIINGSDVEWTKNVDGYKADSRAVITPDTTTGFNIFSYGCAMMSNSKVPAIRVSLGSLTQDPNLGTSPNMVTFRNFLNSNLTPTYSKNSVAGFEVKYTDLLGRQFYSDETQPGTVEFLELVEKEDNAGEYIQFKCKFSCAVKHWGKTITTPIQDSVLATSIIQNATLTGYFTR